MFKLAFISDLHFGSHLDKYTLYHAIKKIKNKDKIDAIVLGGDIAVGIDNIAEVLESFSSNFSSVYVLPGNHDLWLYSTRNDGASYTLYSKLLPDLCSKLKCNYLENNNYILLKDWGLVGTIGWYDYSAKLDMLQLPDDYYKINKFKYNNDGSYVNLGKSDKEFALELKKKLETNINKLLPKVNNLIVCTHVPIFDSAIVYNNNEFWNIGNAYFFNLTLGRYIKTISKLRLVLSGHIHRSISITHKAETGDFIEITSGSDYGNPEINLITIRNNKISSKKYDFLTLCSS